MKQIKSCLTWVVLCLSTQSLCNKDLLSHIEALEPNDTNKKILLEQLQTKWSEGASQEAKAALLFLKASSNKNSDLASSIAAIDEALPLSKDALNLLLIELKINLLLKNKNSETPANIKNELAYLHSQNKNIKKWPRIQRRIYLSLLQAYHQIGDASNFISLFEEMHRAYSDLEKNMTINHEAFVNYELLGKTPQSLYYGEKVLSDFPLTKASVEVYQKLVDLNCQGVYFFSLRALQLMARNITLKTGSEHLIYQLSFEKLRMTDGSLRKFRPMEQVEFLVKLRMYDKAFERSLQLEQAYPAYKKLIDQKDLFFSIAEIAFKLKKFRLSLKYASKYLEQEDAFHPAASELIADNLAYLGYAKDAFRYYQTANNQSSTDLRKWHIFWYKYKIKLATKLQPAKEPPPARDKEFPEGSAYWQAKMNEQLGDALSAKTSFDQIASKHPRSIYASFIKYAKTPDDFSVATAQEAKSARFSVKPSVSNHTSQLPGTYTTLASDLIAMGEKSLGKDLLLDLSKQNEKILLNEHVFDMFERANIFSFIQKIPPAQQKKYEKFRSNELLKIKYPLAFDDVIAPLSEKLQMDPFLIYSIIRAESFYEEDALSWVGAKGLMQIMPYTAIRIADKIQDTDFDVSTLSDPMINIAYGSWYLKELLNVFDNNLPLTIAAYNAGPENVFAWMEKCMGCSLDELIESISYKETRKYVKNVLSNYLTYKEIYEQNSMPVLIQSPIKKISLMKKSKIF